MLGYVLLDATSSSGSSMHQIFLIGSIVLVFYFFMIRPQQRRQKDQKHFLEQLKKGDKLVTVGGIHGRVYSVTDDTVTLEIDSKGAKLTISKDAIAPQQPAAKQ